MLTRTWRWTVATEPGYKVTVTNPTDAELVDACLSGRREAFDVIVERHRRHVYQLCYRFVGNHEDASDLAQDVFIRAYRGLKNFKPLKGLKELRPLKPLFGRTWSDLPARVFFFMGVD